MIPKSDLVTVPFYPTAEMQQAGVNELRSQTWGPATFSQVVAIYRAMLNAVPDGLEIPDGNSLQASKYHDDDDFW